MCIRDSTTLDGQLVFELLARNSIQYQQHTFSKQQKKRFIPQLQKIEG